MITGEQVRYDQDHVMIEARKGGFHFPQAAHQGFDLHQGPVKVERDLQVTLLLHIGN